MPKRKALLAVGTRPEVIKLFPVAIALRERTDLEPVTIALPQQATLVEQTLASLNWGGCTRLRRTRSGFSLAEMFSDFLAGMAHEIEREKPSVVVVQGDTTSALASACAGFYAQVPVAHVEAGLRTWTFERPFPEEMHRACIDVFARFCFAPTPEAAKNLERAGIAPSNIEVTGNTVIDTLNYVLGSLLPAQPLALSPQKRRIVVTCHRRENFERGISALCKAIRTLGERLLDVEFFVVLHPNPNGRDQIERELAEGPSLKRIEPLAYREFLHLLRSAWMVLTDSGGIQEEATALGVPFLVLREETERPEAQRVGCGLLVGTDPDRLVREVLRLHVDEAAYRAMAAPSTVFGDGRAAERIADKLQSALCTL
jgi:UDP-N-acetylglucosamine 2-epimerase (non-hydrolysing)